jgi:hypothetical protein
MVSATLSIAYATGQDIRGFWILVVAWPPFYGLLYLLVNCITLVDKRNLATQQMGKVGKLFPNPSVLDLWFHMCPNLLLLLFPFPFLLISLSLLWGAVSGNLN